MLADSKYLVTPKQVVGMEKRQTQYFLYFIYLISLKSRSKQIEPIE